MTTLLRLIHRDDLATFAQASSPSNPLARAGVAELPYIAFTKDGPQPGQPEALFWRNVRASKIILNGGGGSLFALTPRRRVTAIQELVFACAEQDINPAEITLITDWESWSPLGHGKIDFDFWYAAMQHWPGYIGNYGNAEGKHVEAHPGNKVALSWPWLRDIPRARGVSCPSAYNLGLSVDGLRKTIAVARSRRFYFWGKPRKTVVFLIDPQYHDDHADSANGLGTQLEYLNAAKAADGAVIWTISPKHGSAKYPNFTGEDRTEQDRITLANLRKSGMVAKATGRGG